MKNLIFIYLLLSWIIKPTLGQDEKPFTRGCLLIGGSLSLDFDNTDKFLPGISPLPNVTYYTKRDAIETNLTLGYFLFNNLSMGLKNGIIFSKETTTNSLTTIAEPSISERNVSIGPFIRYYTKSGIFFESSAGLGFLKNLSGNDAIKWDTYSWSAGIGYSIFINKSIAIEPMINYQFLYTNLSELKENEKTRGLNILIGFQIYLNTIKNELNKN